MINLLKYLRGYLIIKVWGFSPERFLNLCSNKNILIWDLHHDKDGYIFKISVAGFRMLKPIVKKTKTRLKILTKVGLPFFFYRYRKRKIFFLGIFLFIGIIYAMSLFIWDIQVTGSYTYTEEMLLKYLNNHQIKPGILKKKIDGNAIEKQMIFDFEEISWISVEVKGTRLKVNLTETQENPNLIKEEYPSSIIADKTGIITSIITRKGTAHYEKGDVVKKGDVLISGEVPIMTDGVQTGINFVYADGDIYAKTIYPYIDKAPILYEEKQYTGNTKKRFALRIINNYINFIMPSIKYTKYDKIVSSSQLHLGDSFYLPFHIERSEYKEYEMVPKNHTDETAAQLLESRLHKYIVELNEKDVEIVENNVTIQLYDTEYIAEGLLIVIEKIGSREKIETYEWRNTENDEFNGNSN